MGNSTTLQKPQKPSPDFPLFAHANGKWAKKIRGKLCYFGRWNNPSEALAMYREQAEDLHAGRTPRTEKDGLTVADMCNRVLAVKEQKVKEGELSPDTLVYYLHTAKVMTAVFGRLRLVEDLGEADFAKLRAKYAGTSVAGGLACKITRSKVFFNFAYKSRWIDKPAWYGMGFDQPSKKALRKAKPARGSLLFSRAEINAMLDAAKLPVRAMILLGINVGYGQSDCVHLDRKGLDLDGSWAEFPRPKTGVYRRAKLWPETTRALREVIERQPKAINKTVAARKLVFLLDSGKPWRDPPKYCHVAGECDYLMRRLGCARPGRGISAFVGHTERLLTRRWTSGRAT